MTFCLSGNEATREQFPRRSRIRTGRTVPYTPDDAATAERRSRFTSSKFILVSDNLKLPFSALQGLQFVCIPLLLQYNRNLTCTSVPYQSQIPCDQLAGVTQLGNIFNGCKTSTVLGRQLSIERPLFLKFISNYACILIIPSHYH